MTTCSSMVVRTFIVEINEWMASNDLNLSLTKMELIWLSRSPQRLKHCPDDELQIAVVGIKPTTYTSKRGCGHQTHHTYFKSRLWASKPPNNVYDLGVMINNDLSLQCECDVNYVTRTCLYHLYQPRVICR